MVQISRANLTGPPCRRDSTGSRTLAECGGIARKRSREQFWTWWRRSIHMMPQPISTSSHNRGEGAHTQQWTTALRPTFIVAGDHDEFESKFVAMQSLRVAIAVGCNRYRTLPPQILKELDEQVKRLRNQVATGGKRPIVPVTSTNQRSDKSHTGLPHCEESLVSGAFLSCQKLSTSNSS